MPPRAGEIYWWDAGDELDRRPAAVVSPQELNRGNNVVIVPFTSRKFSVRSTLPNCVSFRAGTFGLDKDCVAQAENITVAGTTELDLERGPLGVVDGEAMRNLVRAIGYVISAECEPV